MVEAYRTYQLRGYVTCAGYQRIDEVLAECVTLYNGCKEERVKAYKQNVEIYYKQQANQLSDIRKNDAFWQNVSVHIARGVLRRIVHCFL